MTEKNTYISYLRVIATVFVVLIHASTGFLNHFDALSFDWNYANVINSFTRCAVPIFVMLSGALLLHKEEATSVFYKKRVSKLLYPFAFWTIIYLIYYFYKYTNFSLLSTEQILKISTDKILHGANAHLWYLYMILGLYLALPFLGKIVRNATTREIEYFLIFWAASLFIALQRFYDFVPKIDLTFFSGYLGYLILGYYLTIKEFEISKNFALFGFITLGAITTIITLQLSSQANKYDATMYYYLFPTVALAATALFIWAKKQFHQAETMPKWISLIDNYSFGIYLAHILPLNYVHPFITKYVSTAWVIPISTILTIGLSILITYLIRRIPYGKYVSG